VRLNEHSTLQNELASSHHQVVVAHNELSVAYSEASKVHSESFRQLEMRLEAECQQFRSAKEVHHTEIAKCRCALQQLGEMTAADRDASEKRWEETMSLTQEVQSKFEVGLIAVESHVDSFLSAFKSILGEIDDGLAGLRRKIGENDLLNGEIKTDPADLHAQLGERETNGSFKEVANVAQIVHGTHERKPEVINKAHNVHNRHEGDLKGGMRQHCLDTREAPALQIVSAISASQQLKNSISAMKVDNKKLQCEMEVCIDEDSGFTDKQFNQMKVQATELSKDFAKEIRKEQEARPVNVSGYPSEISQIARQWKTIETKFTTPVSLASRPMPCALLQGKSVE